MKKKGKKNESVSYSEITDDVMWEMLRELSTTQTWQAILRYNRIKDAEAINSLASTDPFKEPTIVARTQGIRMGMYSLEREIDTFNANKKEDEKEKEEESSKSE